MHTHTHIPSLICTHVGVCQVDPEVIDFEDIEEITDLVGLPYWILSGSDLHCEDSAPESDYPLDLDDVPEGSKVGLKVTLDGNLHFFINGVDMGMAAAGLPTEGEGLPLLNYSDNTVGSLKLNYYYFVSTINGVTVINYHYMTL